MVSRQPSLTCRTRPPPLRAISGYAPVPGSVGNGSSGHLVNVMAGSGLVTGQCDIPGL